ncbi:apoptosis-associated speck-like protein containing a CARD isoform X1 [Periophthalmus magnuspinnatus]|uniref:apoptosis-associated speck-like protein containing a CARD isoform X1 n=1 Tax=Periophthalmus magnuspinnatus TaxID=409849 RepID=UPI002436F0EE|nr:apoptosis-associated speck-like protein containing a CARD isoform X1 [Periophthalmus magnuspinnatus]
MPQNNIPMRILHVLEQLEKKDLDKFLLKLQDSSEEPRIRAAEVEGKSRVDIAMLLVSRCTGPGALHRTITTLRHIGCNEEAQELEEEAKDVLQPASTGQDSGASPGPGASAAPDTHRAAAEGNEHFVDRHRKQLTDRVSNINPVLDELLVSGVLSSEQYSTVRAIRPTQEQMRFLYEGPLKSGGKRSKDQLLSALEDQEKYLIEDLREGQS